MRRDLVLCVCLSVLIGTGASRAAPEAPGQPVRPQLAQADLTRRALPVEGVITNPDWVSKPGPDDYSRLYPSFATFLGVEGHAIISCLVTVQGGLADCSVTSETPKGFRFGEATLKMANMFRMRPMSVDGAPVGGQRINIPVRYRLPNPPTPVPAPTSAAVAASPRGLALGRRVAAVTTDAMMAGWTASAEKWKTYLNPLSPEEQLALDSYGQAMAAGMPKEIERFGEIYAKSYTEQELTDIAKFLESPSGRAWFSRQKAMSEAMQAEAAQFQKTVSADARDRLCASTACPTAPAQPAAAR
jgi:TonB family protein